MAATYSKLRDGSWGVRVTGTRPAEGAEIEVTKKDGTTNKAKVGKVLFSGDGFHLCSVAGGTSVTAGGRRKSRLDREDERCDLCGANKYTCGHCIGW